jgi:acetyl-CoA C-acetyltransferase
MKRKVAIIQAKRSPIGTLGGVLSSLSPSALGTQVALATLEGKIPTLVVVGNVVSAGLGQNIARQIALGAHLPVTTEAYTVNKVCGSGLKSIEMGFMEIASGNHEVVLAGGIEVLSQAPFYLPKKSRTSGLRFGDQTLEDSILKDALEDPFDRILMGDTAEELAELYGISREDQDEFALLSQKRVQEAQALGLFEKEIVPIEIEQGRTTFHFSQDEQPRGSTTLESLARLKPVFSPQGSVTAGNASALNDGAAFVLLASEEKVKEWGTQPLAWIEGFSSVGLAPRRMGLGPVEALTQLLKKLSWKMEEVDHIELNEAFAVQVLAVLKEWRDYAGNLELTHINPLGGSIALGHPLGATGTRLVVTLAHSLARADQSKGIVTLCIGGGQGMAMGISRPQEGL